MNGTGLINRTYPMPKRDEYLTTTFQYSHGLTYRRTQVALIWAAARVDGLDSRPRELGICIALIHPQP